MRRNKWEVGNEWWVREVGNTSGGLGRWETQVVGQGGGKHKWWVREVGNEWWVREVGNEWWVREVGNTSGGLGRWETQVVG
jgi:hypothetical protein